MTTSTTTPVEAGTIYPMPPKPNWADDKPDLTEGSIGWSHSLTNGEHPYSVGVARRDWIRVEAVEVGDVEVYVEADDKFSASQAREFAALLVQAADLAESQE